MPHAGAEVIPARIKGQDRRGPEQADADVSGDRQDPVACLAGNAEADRKKLEKRLPLRELRAA